MKIMYTLQVISMDGIPRTLTCDDRSEIMRFLHNFDSERSVLTLTLSCVDNESVYQLLHSIHEPKLGDGKRETLFTEPRTGKGSLD